MSRNTANASACRPDRYRASISCPRSRSRVGNSCTSAVSSPTSSTERPRASSASRHSSHARERDSSHLVAAARTTSLSTPVNAAPRHSANAARNPATASASRPAVTSVRARATSDSNSHRSNSTGPDASRYPPEAVRSASGGNSRRSRDTQLCT